MHTQRRIFIFLATWLLAAQAQAIQISAAGQRFTVDWWPTGIDAPGSLSATSTWTVTAFSDRRIVLDIDITNTSKLIGELRAVDITAFGFGTAQLAGAGLLTAGRVFDRVGSGHGPRHTFPGGFKDINICLFALECPGGSVRDALHAGASDHLQLLLEGGFDDGFADLLYMPLKFQTSLGSYETGGCINCTPVSVPEPPVVALLGIGLLLIGLGRLGKPRFAAARHQRP